MTTVTSGAERWVNDERARDDVSRSAGFQPANLTLSLRADGEIQPRQLEAGVTKNETQQQSFIRLGYSPFPKQQLFHGSPAKYRLFGGAAGPGKSKALLMETCIQALEAPGASTLLLRRTFSELEQSLLIYFRRDVPRELYKSYNESKHVVTWLNDSTTRFGYCAAENDVYQYQGAEFVFIGIDELTLFTLRQWQFLTSRNRCPLPGAFPCMAAATNPGNIGHSWVKSLWIDRQPASGMESPEQYDPADYEFIGAKFFDNPIYAADAGYHKTLNALPSHLRRAFLEGDWDVFAGQYFDRFDPSTQVFRAEQFDWKPWWPRWISIDWGYEHPSAVYWHASAPAAAAAPQNIFRHAADTSAPSRSVPVAFTGTNLTLPLSSPFGANDEIQNLPAGSRRSNPPNYDAVSGTPASSRQGLPLRSSLYSPPGADALGLAPAQPFAPSPSLEPESARSRVITYREHVTHRTAPRELARQIIERSLQSSPPPRTAGVSPAPLPSPLPLNSPLASPTAGAPSVAPQPSSLSSRQRADVWPDEGSASALSSENQQQIPRRPTPGLARDDTFSFGVQTNVESTREKIDAIYLSPDAFARRTDEASIADQMGDIFVAAGLPRPVPADDDRVGGWMLMYQMLDAGEWLLTENCIELIRTLPTLVRDSARVEDVEKMDGDDPADAARYGLKTRYAAHPGRAPLLPLEQRIEQRVTSSDPTVRAIQIQKARFDESRRNKPKHFTHHHRPRPRR